MSERELRELVAAACRILQNEGQEHFNLGHVSARESGAERIIVKPSGLGLGEIRPEDLVVADFNGRKLAGERPLHSEMPIHLEIYRRRPEVVCVVHTHAIYAAALSATTAGFQMVSQDSVLFSNGIGYYGSALLIVTPEQGRAMAESLGDYHAVLLKNHGIAVVGRTVQEATVRAVAFDRSARLQLAASQLGPLSPIQPNEAQEMGAGFERSVARTLGIWEYLLRKADRNGPARV